MTRPDRSTGARRTATRAAAVLSFSALAGFGYMLWEARWIRFGRADLAIPDLPPSLSGLKILHLSDVHAGEFSANDRNLERVVDWAGPLSPDLVFLTGDVLGGPRESRRSIELLRQLEPRLGMFAVSGNHEYGLGQGPLSAPRDSGALWREAGITLLADSCVTLELGAGETLLLCGADYLTGGFPLAADACPVDAGTFAVLLIHEPPPADSPLAGRFSLAFAGHTHGGQLRVPSRKGLVPLYDDAGDFLEGVCPWGGSLLVVSRGIGTSFVPFRLFARPEATLWRLV